MGLIIYAFFSFATSILGGYTLKFSSANHHWGRILAGKSSVESEVKKASDDQGKASYARSQAVNDLGFMDAITPRSQGHRQTIFYICSLLILIIGFIFFKWYIAIFAFILSLIITIIVKQSLPPSHSPFYKNKIIAGLRNRVIQYEKENDSNKAAAAKFFMDKLMNAKSDMGYNPF